MRATSQFQNTNKRQMKRVNVDMLLNKYVKGRPYLCVAADISSGGMKVRKIREPLLDEKEVGLQFQLPGDDRVISCAGRIIHEDNDSFPHTGIRFTSISPEHQRIIDDYVDRLNQAE